MARNRKNRKVILKKNQTAERMNHTPKANRNEVIAMSIFEYDKEEEEKKLRKAEYEAGIQVGRQEGRQETKKEIALQMLKAGVPGEEIVRFTGYTVEQLQKIKETAIRL